MHVSVTNLDEWGRLWAEAKTPVEVDYSQTIHRHPEPIHKNNIT